MDMENIREELEAIENENVEENTTKFKRDYAPHRRVSTRVCKSCGKTYVMPDSDMAYYFTKFGTFPLKCEECRKKNREMNPIAKEEITTEDNK